MMREALPYHGVKVVDFGQYIAGPAVAMILGDLGATALQEARSELITVSIPGFASKDELRRE